ncbi:hypothetical protein [Brevifollis gellanilyticus]|uniref:hypothetical protein n=1 Tax=Brevifollis gellanilyticus TaxID=748831 RepID=UPI0011BFDD82|nr:hypothetical protein [Brevifollis gellanilyticus]
MKIQSLPKTSVKRSLAALALMAASSAVPAGALDLSATLATAINTTIDFAPADLPIPASQAPHGAVMEMSITESGAFTLRVQFPKFTYRKTGVLIEHESSTPEEPFYTADIPGSGGVAGIHVERYVNGIVGVWWDISDENGGGLLGGYALAPTIRRDGNANYTPAAYNTVFLRAGPILQDGENSTPDDPKLGTGHGSLIVLPSGRSIFAGVLPDGKHVVGSGPLTDFLSVPIMLEASGGKDSLVCNMPTMVIEDTFQWYKSPSTHDPIWPAGGQLGGWVSTAPYTPPASGEYAVRGVYDQPLNATLEFLAADRPGAGTSRDPVPFLSQPFRLKLNHQAVFPAPNAAKLDVNFHPQTGFFTGSVKLPATPPLKPKKVSFSGVVKQYENDSEAEGFYLADPLPGTLDVPQVSGLVRILPYVLPGE